MQNFVAIDFETANSNAASACAVGLTVVRDGEIVDSYSTLVRPPTMDFSPWNTRVHRIKPADVAGKPTFDGIWPDLATRLAGLPMVAHNASFDMRVLYATLDVYGIAQPTCKWLCSLGMARDLLPGLPNHKLGTLAMLFGLSLKHHDAGADALVCAELAIRFGRLLGSDRVASFAVDYPQVCASRGRTAVSESSTGLPPPEADELDDEVAEDDAPVKIDLVATAKADGRFVGRRFVFTGEFAHMSRAEAQSEAAQQGGTCSTSVSSKTDYVVVGDNVLMGEPTGKLRRAKELCEQGVLIQIIDEAAFLQMLREPIKAK